MSVLGAIFVLAGAASVIERDGKRDRRAYPDMNKKEVQQAFDDENAEYGIMHNMSEEKIYKIAARCRVRPDKHGILPLDGHKKCEPYVIKYLNSNHDLSDFRHTWRDCIRRQKNDNIKRNNDVFYGEKQYRRYVIRLSESNNFAKGGDIVLEINHWNNLPKDEHLKRMERLQNNTILGYIVRKPPILRDNPKIYGAHTEFWFLREDEYSNMEDLYYCCCQKLGYNPEGPESRDFVDYRTIVKSKEDPEEEEERRRRYIENEKTGGLAPLFE